MQSLQQFFRETCAVRERSARSVQCWNLQMSFPACICGASGFVAWKFQGCSAMRYSFVKLTLDPHDTVKASHGALQYWNAARGYRPAGTQ